MTRWTVKEIYCSQSRHEERAKVLRKKERNKTDENPEGSKFFYCNPDHSLT